METYNDVLETAAEKEWHSLFFWVVVLLVMMGIVWISHYIYFRNMKNKHPKKYTSKKQTKVRRQSIGAAALLTVVCFGLGAIICFDTVKTNSDIAKDIEQNAYITYNGGYYIGDDVIRRELYDKWMLVDFDNGDYAFIYMDSVFERISTEAGRCEGTVVYGKNSLIVVDMEN